MDLPKSSQTPSKIIRSFVTETGIPLLTLSNACELQSIETLKWWSGKSQIMRFKHIAKLANYLGVPEESILNADHNRQLIRRRIFDSRIALPEIYEENAESYVRSSSYILEYLHLLHGQKFVDTVLVQMNIHPCYFDQVERKINLRFVIDILNLCKTYGFTNKDFHQLARSVFLGIEGTSAETVFPTTETYGEAYELIAENSQLFDRNFEYKITHGTDFTCILATPLDHTVSIIDTYCGDSKILHDYRGILFAAIPSLCRLNPLEIAIRSRCYFSGDKVSEYKIMHSNK
ncbi:MAG: hypothetical protein H6623_00385 [Bdellovibrionaceae bacterium]|nr:hypothetical protein [Pseudobdellovibrionaceae bacterium]